MTDREPVIRVDAKDPHRAAEDVAAYMETGELGATLSVQPLEELLAEGRVADCTCGMLACVCATLRAHPDPKCQFRISVQCAVGIECEHGFDVCPKCDPCTCATPTGEPPWKAVTDDHDEE